MKRMRMKYFDVPILGGKFKGKKIRIPDLPTTRSSKSILRESLFDTLQFDIMGTPFVEVFAGSGSVGLEALSRGAKHVYFLERNREVFDLLQNNIRHIDPQHSTAIIGDSFTSLPPLLDRLRSEATAGYFYFDPPFSIREGMVNIYERTLALIERIDPEICKKVIVEHMTKLSLPDEIGSLKLIRKKRFGKSSLSYYTPDFDV